MTNERKKEVRFSLIPTIKIVDEESRSVCGESTSEVEAKHDEIPAASSHIPKLLPRTPPDSLMFPLFNAIQRGAWTRARKLSYELLLCDPKRVSYIDLYRRLEQITHLIDRRLHPQEFIQQATVVNNEAERSDQEPPLEK